LIDNRQFLRSLVKAERAQRAVAASYVAAVTQACPGVLDGLGPITLAAEKPAVQDVIAEGLGDLEVTVIAPGRGALGTFARRATSLKWSSPTTNGDVRRYFTAEDALYGTQPSDLCADAGALVADSGQTEPPQTLQWLRTFEHLTQEANAAGRVFGRDLNRLSGPEDVPVIVTTHILAAKLQANEQRLLQSNVNLLLAALGLPASVRVQDAVVKEPIRKRDPRSESRFPGIEGSVIRKHIHRMTSGSISASRITTRAPRIGTPSSSSRRR
jgi:hypothetical protein